MKRSLAFLFIGLGFGLLASCESVKFSADDTNGESTQPWTQTDSFSGGGRFGAMPQSR